MRILVCTGRICARKNSHDVERILRAGLPGHDVLESECLGDCSNAPVIQHDDDLESPFPPEEAERVAADEQQATTAAP